MIAPISCNITSSATVSGTMKASGKLAARITSCSIVQSWMIATKAQTVNITNRLCSQPSGADYTTLQDLADLGSGIGAQVVGQPYDVYRITQTGDVLQSHNLVMQSYPVERQKLTAADSQGLETTIAQKTFFFSLGGDFSSSIVGDCFILNDPVYGVGASIVNYPTLQFGGFYLGIHPVLQKPIGVRIDRLVQIYRPAVMPDANGYMDTTLNGASPIMLVNGVATIGTPGEITKANFVPAGFMPDKRSGSLIVEGYTRDIPQHTNWAVAIPPIPVKSTIGKQFFSIREGDIIVSQEGDRYRVTNPMRQDAGLVGYQLTCEREIAQAGGSL